MRLSENVVERQKNWKFDDDYQKQRVLHSDFNFLRFLCYNLRKTITLQWDSKANDQLEIEIGKSMMSSVFWEMWNENHGEIDEKVWVNQKKKKIKDEILGFVICT